ncbi:MAG: hypothetical protein C4539_02590 [Ignavibacteriales bacterium]|nr:MAG: hypothetical protein C4539_02590 [Ignavibacteriales bacterium]
MKRYKYIFVATILLSVLYSGCILDAFDELVQNFSVERSFIIQGNTNNITPQTSSFSLEDSDVYEEYKNKIKDISFVAASVTVDSIDTPSLQGDMILTLKDANGNTLFTHTFNDVKPADYYKNKAMLLTLTQAEMTAVNNYIDGSSNKTFTGSLDLENVTPANTNIYLKCTLDVAFELVADL